MEENFDEYDTLNSTGACHAYSSPQLQHDIHDNKSQRRIRRGSALPPTTLSVLTSHAKPIILHDINGLQRLQRSVRCNVDMGDYATQTSTKEILVSSRPYKKHKQGQLIRPHSTPSGPISMSKSCKGHEDGGGVNSNQRHFTSSLYSQQHHRKRAPTVLVPR